MHRASRAWLVMAVVFFASVAITVNQFKVPPVLQILMADMGVGFVTGGWLMSLFAVAGVLLAIPGALLLARVGFKVSGLLALACCMAGAALGAVAANAPMLLAGRMIEGISAGLMGVTAPATISAWFGPRERGLPLGIWAAWVPVGSVIAFNVAHPLQTAFGWQAVWWFGLGLTLLAFLLYAMVVSDPPGAGQSAGSPAVPWTRGLVSVPTWLLALAFGAFAFSLLSYNTWIPTFLTGTLTIEPATASFYASLIFLAAIPGNVVAGWAINRVHTRYGLLVGVYLISCVLFAGTFRLWQPTVIVLYLLALGFVTNFIPTLAFTLAPEAVGHPSLAGISLAMMSMGANAGVLVGPPILGALIEAWGWTLAGWVLVAVMMLGTLASVLAWKRAER
jgi:predicted MFS family arabinose efflux permease